MYVCRNAIQWYQYDPTKWLILAWHACGLVTELKTFSENEIKLGTYMHIIIHICRKHRC